MYPELYQYLLLNKNLPVPGVGTFLLERKPAQVDFPNRQVLPPVYSLALDTTNDHPSKKIFNWLATALGITPHDAVIRYNDFAFGMKKQVEAGDVIDWAGVGVLKKGLAGELRFNPSVPSVQELPLPAIKVLREKAEHTVRVGEEEKTAAEMETMLAQAPEKKSYWWAYALIIGLLSLVFIGWYLSEHGVDTLSVANGKKLVPAEETPSYKLLQ